MVIFKCYFSREHIALSYKTNGANIELDKNQQIKSTVHDAKSHFNQSIKSISNQIKKLDIQCTFCNIHGKLSYNKHVTTLNL